MNVNLDYCYKVCCKGKKTAEKFLEESNSAYDAALDFSCFIEKCFKTCPYKDEHKKEN